MGCREDGGEHGNPLQNSYLETRKDRATQLATVHKAIKSQAYSAHTHAHM